MRFDTIKYIGTDLINVPERELVQYILNEASTLYSFFNFVVEPAIGPPPRVGWDYLFFAEIERVDLGLPPGQPGDIDVLIIPTKNGAIVPEYACAIEVKRLALRGPNWSKNVDRYGISQANGLLRCGFPYVGLLHLIISAEGPQENWCDLHEYRVLDEYGHAEFVREISTDMTGFYAAERQLARLLQREPHPSIGLNCVALSKSHRMDTDNRIWYSISDPAKRLAKRNPWAHPRMIENLKIVGNAMQSCASPRPADERRLNRQRS